MLHCLVPANFYVCISMFCLKSRYASDYLNASPNFLVFFCNISLMLALRNYIQIQHSLLCLCLFVTLLTPCPPEYWNPDSSTGWGTDRVQSMQSRNKLLEIPIMKMAKNLYQPAYLDLTTIYLRSNSFFLLILKATSPTWEARPWVWSLLLCNLIEC